MCQCLATNVSKARIHLHSNEFLRECEASSRLRRQILRKSREEALIVLGARVIAPETLDVGADVCQHPARAKEPHNNLPRLDLTRDVPVRTQRLTAFVTLQQGSPGRAHEVPAGPCPSPRNAWRRPARR